MIETKRNGGLTLLALASLAAPSCTTTERSASPDPIGPNTTELLRTQKVSSRFSDLALKVEVGQATHYVKSDNGALLYNGPSTQSAITLSHPFGKGSLEAQLWTHIPTDNPDHPSQEVDVTLLYRQGGTVLGFSNYSFPMDNSFEDFSQAFFGTSLPTNTPLGELHIKPIYSTGFHELHGERHQRGTDSFEVKVGITKEIPVVERLTLQPEIYSTLVLDDGALYKDTGFAQFTTALGFTYSFFNSVLTGQLSFTDASDPINHETVVLRIGWAKSF